LAGQLAEAGEEGAPAIVVGDRDLAGQASNVAADAGQVVPILVDGTPPAGCPPISEPRGASAYFFDYPEENRSYRLTSGGHSIPAFGSGTLGYLEPQRAQETDFVGASGFLLASVDVAGRDKATNVAPVHVRLIPNIGALALDATDGTLLRRSHPALFAALARRPLAGGECSGNFAPGSCEGIRPDPYVPIPARCQGARCASGVLPEYTFSSSNPEIADFVAADPRSPNPRNVLLVGEKPVLDPHSGLLCAFNPGTTTVTVSTGGLAYSAKVTVLGGTAQRPCGTKPVKRSAVLPPEPEPLPKPEEREFAQPPLPPPPPAPVLPSPSLASQPTPHLPPPPPPMAGPTFFPATVAAPPVVPIVPPPPVPAAQPTPPSGTSPVSEREEDAAYDLVHHMVALHLPSAAGATLAAKGGASEARGGSIVPLPAIAILAAIAAAAGISGPRRRHRPKPAYQATTTRRYR
jgi:hypothetical protein